MNRNSNLDLIRLFAFVLLVTCHTCDPFNAAATYGAGEPNPEFTRWGAVWGSVVRPCVPLFVMLTGALLYLQNELSGFVQLLDLQSLLIVDGAILLLGILLTVVATFFAVNKYLRMRGDQLYYI